MTERGVGGEGRGRMRGEGKGWRVKAAGNDKYKICMGGRIICKQEVTNKREYECGREGERKRANA